MGKGGLSAGTAGSGSFGGGALANLFDILRCASSPPVVSPTMQEEREMCRSRVGDGRSSRVETQAAEKGRNTSRKTRGGRKEEERMRRNSNVVKKKSKK